MFYHVGFLLDHTSESVNYFNLKRETEMVGIKLHCIIFHGDFNQRLGPMSQVGR